MEDVFRCLVCRHEWRFNGSYGLCPVCGSALVERVRNRTPGAGGNMVKNKDDVLVGSADYGLSVLTGLSVLLVEAIGLVIGLAEFIGRR